MHSVRLFPFAIITFFILSQATNITYKIHFNKSYFVHHRSDWWSRTSCKLVKTEMKRMPKFREAVCVCRNNYSLPSETQNKPRWIYDHCNC